MIDHTFTELCGKITSDHGFWPQLLSCLQLAKLCLGGDADIAKWSHTWESYKSCCQKFNLQKFAFEFHFTKFLFRKRETFKSTPPYTQETLLSKAILKCNFKKINLYSASELLPFLNARICLLLLCVYLHVPWLTCVMCHLSVMSDVAVCDPVMGDCGKLVRWTVWHITFSLSSFRGR